MADRPNPLVTVAAAVYLLGALPLLFAPVETLAALDVPITGLEVALLQLLAAALFGFAMLCWTSRFARIGGIFGRPLVISNFAHTMTAALLVGKLALRAPVSPGLRAVAAVAAALAVAFGARLFLPPSEPARPVAVN